MKAKEKVVMPQVIKEKVIECLTDDDILYDVATIIRLFLRSTWLIEPSASYFLDLKKKNFIDPMIQLLSSKLKLPEKNIEDICEALTKPFLNPEFAEILIGKTVLAVDKAYSSRTSRVDKFIHSKVKILEYINLLVETSGETWDVLGKSKSAFLPKNYDKILLDLIDKRREHIKDYYHFEIDDSLFSAKQCLVRSYALKLCWYNWNQPIYWFKKRFELALYFFAAALIVAPVFYMFNAELSLQNAGLIFSISMTVAIVVSGIADGVIGHLKTEKPLHPQLMRYYEYYLMNQIIMKELLEHIKNLYPEESKELQKKSSKLLSNRNSQKNVMPNLNQDDSREHNFAPELSSESGGGGKKIINKNKEKINAKIEEVNNRLDEYKNRGQVFNQEIVWKIEKESKRFVEVIYHPLRDIFKIIELWTLNSSKKSLNGRHYVRWSEEKIRELVGKKNERLYSDFFRIGQIGRIANYEDEQGYINAENYAQYPWKIKSRGKESGAYRLFFEAVSIVSAKKEVSADSDSTELTLYDAAEFRKTH